MDLIFFIDYWKSIWKLFWSFSIKLIGIWLSPCQLKTSKGYESTYDRKEAKVSRVKIEIIGNERFFLHCSYRRCVMLENPFICLEYIGFFFLFSRMHFAFLNSFSPPFTLQPFVLRKQIDCWWIMQTSYMIQANLNFHFRFKLMLK